MKCSKCGNIINQGEPVCRICNTPVTPNVPQNNNMVFSPNNNQQFNSIPNQTARTASMPYPQGNINPSSVNIPKNVTPVSINQMPPKPLTPPVSGTININTPPVPNSNPISSQRIGKVPQMQRQNYQIPNGPGQTTKPNNNMMPNYNPMGTPKNANLPNNNLQLSKGAFQSNQTLANQSNSISQPSSNNNQPMAIPNFHQPNINKSSTQKSSITTTSPIVPPQSIHTPTNQPSSNISSSNPELSPTPNSPEQPINNISSTQVDESKQPGFNPIPSPSLSEKPLEESQANNQLPIETPDNQETKDSVEEKMNSQSIPSIDLTQVPNNSFQSDDELVNAYIGKKANKILNSKFSLCSLFLGATYYCYRKMWLIGILMWLICSVLCSFLNIIGLVISIVLQIVSAVMFKKLYLDHVTKKINQIKTKNSEKTPDELITICRKKGGTSIIPIIIAILEFVALVILIIVVILGASQTVSKTKVKALKLNAESASFWFEREYQVYLAGIEMNENFVQTCINNSCYSVNGLTASAISDTILNELQLSNADFKTGIPRSFIISENDPVDSFVAINTTTQAVCVKLTTKPSGIYGATAVVCSEDCTSEQCTSTIK